MTEPNTTIEPSTAITSLISTVSANPDAAAGIQAMTQRAAEFPSPLQATLAGIAADPDGRQLADQTLDAYWADPARRTQTLNAISEGREVIIGAGFHAAVYAAVRVLSGYPKPIVVDRADRVGGTFAMTARPTFYLNSRNRAGIPGLAGDQGASLNYLPGALVQPADVSMAQYQTNTDMALVIRLALAQYAEVAPATTVVSVTGDQNSAELEFADADADPVRAGRVIDARGLGDARSAGLANGVTILTFAQFMTRMAGLWPLRGVRRVAVVGGGDSGKCAVESLLGIAPPTAMTTASLDAVDRIAWYAELLPTTCDDWQNDVRGRYQSIGRFLRPDRFGVQRLSIVRRRVTPTALPGMVLLDGRTYDLVVMCTGNRETEIAGLPVSSFDEYGLDGETVVARKHYNLPVFRVGPHANLPFTRREREDGIADIPANAVAMFRTATKTAALAATLGPLRQV